MTLNPIVKIKKLINSDIITVKRGELIILAEDFNEKKLDDNITITTIGMDKLKEALEKPELTVDEEAQFNGEPDIEKTIKEYTKNIDLVSFYMNILTNYIRPLS